jgi:hypothetical protein
MAMVRWLGWLALAGEFSLMVGCASASARKIEPLLAAAGFKMLLADTPEKVAHLETLTPHKLVPHVQDGQTVYIYADPDVCSCAYVGDELAYQRYQEMALARKIAADQRAAAQLNRDASMNWGVWGPIRW